MATPKNQLMRIGGIVLELGLGVFLVVMLVSAWNSQSYASSGAKLGKTVTSSRSALVPSPGTPVFTFCLQDDSNRLNVVQFNAGGEYIFCCNGVVLASGVGVVTVRGGFIEIQHNTQTFRVLIKADTTVKKGTATLQMPPGVVKCIIGDRNMADNTCTCGAPAG